MLIYVLYSNKQEGGSSFGTADDGDSGAGGGGRPFPFLKKESSEVIIRKCSSHVRRPGSF